MFFIWYLPNKSYVFFVASIDETCLLPVTFVVLRHGISAVSLISSCSVAQPQAYLASIHLQTYFASFQIFWFCYISVEPPGSMSFAGFSRVSCSSDSAWMNFLFFLGALWRGRARASVLKKEISFRRKNKSYLLQIEYFNYICLYADIPIQIKSLVAGQRSMEIALMNARAQADQRTAELEAPRRPATVQRGYWRR